MRDFPLRKLGLDLGIKSCGFAITDENCVLVSPLENYLFNKNNFLQVINRINYWFKEYDDKIDTIILGYPTNTDDSKNARTFMVESFYDLLKQHFSTRAKIFLEDERYSTKIATEQLMQYGLKASQRSKIKDKMAAVVILNHWLIKKAPS